MNETLKVNGLQRKSEVWTVLLWEVIVRFQVKNLEILMNMYRIGT